MAIQPIDLQVLFSRLAHMAKEQAVTEGVAGHQQVQQATEIIKRSDAQDHSVNQTAEVSHDEIHRVAKDERRGRERRDGQAKKDKKREEEPEVVKDPNLGRRIDISG